MDVEVRGVAGVGADPNFYIFSLHLGDGFEKRWKTIVEAASATRGGINSSAADGSTIASAQDISPWHNYTLVLKYSPPPPTLSLLICTRTRRPRIILVCWFSPPSTQSSTFTSRLSGSTKSFLPIPVALPAKYAERKEGSTGEGRWENFVSSKIVFVKLVIRRYSHLICGKNLRQYAFWMFFKNVSFYRY